MRILAIGEDPQTEGAYIVVDSETGEKHEIDELPKLIATGNPGVLAGHNLYHPVAELHQFYKDFKSWTIRIQANDKVITPLGKEIRVGEFHPLYFGFKRGHRLGKAQVFHCLDVSELCDSEDETVGSVMEHARSVLSLCEERGIKFTGSRGGLASKMLKASPYFTHDRTPAPRFINEKARPELPGNHYSLGTREHVRHDGAVYIDQVSCHHQVAATVDTPDPTLLRARGHYLSDQPKVWLKPDQAKEFIKNNYGLYKCQIWVSAGRIPDHIKPEWFRGSPGRRTVYMYHNEFEYLSNYDVHLEFIISAWVSPQSDQAIKEYANFALSHRNIGPGRKPVLLAAYGALATRSDRESVSYIKASPAGHDTELLPIAGELRKITVKPQKNRQPNRVTNVIARGVIEAETRKRSLFMARDLMENHNAEILSIYADGIILKCDQLPLLPSEWIVESELNNLRFRHPTSFESKEMVKMPGVPHDSDGRAFGRMVRARTSGLTPAGVGATL